MIASYLDVEDEEESEVGEMTFRFRRRLKLVPMCTVNHHEQRSGITSTTACRSHGPTRVGIPGTGMSYHYLSPTPPERPYAATQNGILHATAREARYCSYCEMLVLGKKRRNVPLLGFFLDMVQCCPRCLNKTTRLR